MANYTGANVINAGDVSNYQADIYEFGFSSTSSEVTFFIAQTTNDILIKLPNSNLDKALIYLKKIYKNKELLEKKIIDLRIPNQVIILNE